MFATNKKFGDLGTWGLFIYLYHFCISYNGSLVLNAIAWQLSQGTEPQADKN
ncbi:hypothetical protein [Pleurocapsa sp. CCALA 161]|uniref:hypothetical protein n=1 Tax=Pleurocapsa sp. CCALA 161 TaxID=2107688 RepID=UPI001304BD88|nr:hypothetical protein [Pleurocapsa sp. CCALA 161]